MFTDIQKRLAEREPKPLGKQRYFSVLLPIIMVAGVPNLLYEVRSQHISQPGETSFPGGAVEAGETYEAAAIRETMEELNLPFDRIHILGEMDYIVSAQVVIRSFVAELKDVQLEDIVCNEEVEEVFAIPLDYLLTHKPTYYTVSTKLEHPENFPYELIPGGEKYDWKSGHQAIAFYHLENHQLWGYTAGLTARFIELLKLENPIE